MEVFVLMKKYNLVPKAFKKLLIFPYFTVLPLYFYYWYISLLYKLILLVPVIPILLVPTMSAAKATRLLP